MKNITLHVSGLCSFLIAVLGLASCGGGSGFAYEPPPDTTDPSISNLTLSQVSALQNDGGGWITIDISVDFVDLDSDVNYMGANFIDSSGSFLYVRGVYLDQLVGQISGTAQGTMDIDTSRQGQFTIRVWLMDETFRTSNRLEAHFSVI